MYTKKIIIWDNSGTITGSKNPNDASESEKVILPNVEKAMKQAGAFNVICSGCKTPKSEQQYFDPEKIIENLKKLMTSLPVDVATFSAATGGVECWVIIKKNNGNSFEIRKAHEDIRYKHLIGQFKKPSTGMLTVIEDVLQEYGLAINEKNTTFIGDRWHDIQAARSFRIPFLYAKDVHHMKQEFRHINTIKWEKLCENAEIQELICAWQNFLKINHWQDLIKGCKPVTSGCGLIYELPNYLNRPNESFAIVDMRQITTAEPHYHPDNNTEIYFVLQGSAGIYIDRIEHEVNPGDVVIISPNEIHYTLPDREFVIGAVNTPPFKPENYIPLSEEELIDHLQG